MADPISKKPIDETEQGRTLLALIEQVTVQSGVVDQLQDETSAAIARRDAAASQLYTLRRELSDAAVAYATLTGETETFVELDGRIYTLIAPKADRFDGAYSLVELVATDKVFKVKKKA